MIQEFVEANPLKTTPLEELTLEFQSLCLALRLPTRRTGFTPLKKTERSALTKQCSGNRWITTSLTVLPLTYFTSGGCIQLLEIGEEDGIIFDGTTDKVHGASFLCRVIVPMKNIVCQLL